MQSAAATVDAYLAEVPPERRDVLAAIRRLCRDLLPGYTEAMAYGMPTYAKDGALEFAFASQKRYISIYGLTSDTPEAHWADFAGASVGKCCIRYTNPKKVDLAAVERLIKSIAASNSPMG